MPRQSAASPPNPLRIPRLLNKGLEAAWARGISTRPGLESGTLIDAAIRREGEAPTDGGWREALDRLTDDLRHCAELSPLGCSMAHGQLVGILRQRIRAARLWAREPGIFEDPVPAPVIILGHMRSGTTRLQRLLACDPRFSYTRLHESMSPLGRQPHAWAAAGAVRVFLGISNPALRRIHPSGPSAPEEEFGLHAFSLHGAMFEAQWHVPRFARWDESRDLTEVYDEFRRLVQTLRWRRGDPRQRVQLLKAPQFMQELDAVLAALPDARIIRIERDLGEVLGSSASLVWNQQRVQSNQAEPRRTGREWLRKTRLRESRASQALARHPSVPLLSVSYAAMNRDWHAETKRIYDFLGMALPPSVLQRMTRIAASSAHQGHRYALDQFGLDEEAAAAAPCQSEENGGRGKD